jgi:Uma2 family endonuclease
MSFGLYPSYDPNLLVTPNPATAMNVPIIHPAPDLPPRRAFNVEDIRRMIEIGVLAEDENIELVEGEIVVMAAKSYAHERVKTALARALILAAPADVEVTIEATIEFSPNILLEPDIAVFPRSRMRKSDAGFITLDQGGCSLLIEVAASSLNYDRGRKATLYAKLGIQEFWVVDVNARCTWVYDRPSSAGWAPAVKRGADDVLTTPALPRLAFKLSDIDY